MPTGTVLVHLPGKPDFVPLTIGDPLPLGAIIDATHGVIKLVVPCDPALDKKCEGGIQSGDFYGGRFEILRTRGNKPVTELVLESAIGSKKPKPNGIPTAGVSAWSPLHVLASAKRKKSMLWGTAKGRFRTRGRYAAATVRGTKWLTDDRKPNATTVRVTEGSVTVRDFVKRKNVTVKQGKRYSSKRKKKR